MPKQTLFEYEAYAASPRIKPNGECVLTFLTNSGSILIRMDRLVFEGLLKRAQQEAAKRPPPKTS